VNDCNFIVGYDYIDALSESEEQLAAVTRGFKHCGNIMPSWAVQEATYMKSVYMKRAIALGIPVAPSLFAPKEGRTAESLLEDIQSQGWKDFILKQSYSSYSIGVKKMHVADCVADPQILKDYFDEFADCPEYVVQEFIEGFTRNWEVRCYWFEGEFLYAIANRSAVSTAEGEQVGIITEDDIPQDFLERAKEIGKHALKALPQDGSQTLVRTDIGCSDSCIHDKDYQHWNEAEKTFFLNEIEPTAPTIFPRVLKFDSIPVWAEHYARKATEFGAKSRNLQSPPLKAGYPHLTCDTVDTLDSLTACGQSEKSTDEDFAPSEEE
jgi:hypothetical protein